MNRRRLEVSVALALSIAVALLGFRLLSGPTRTLEQTAVLGLFSGLRPRVAVLGGHTFQVLPAHQVAFRAYLTPFCSSLVSILALGAIATCVLRGTTVRRVFAFIAAATFVVGCNVLRIAASLWAGLQFGPSGLVLFHDWLGTIFGLLYTLGGFLLMLYLILPSASAQIQRAARTSDVL